MSNASPLIVKNPFGGQVLILEGPILYDSKPNSSPTYTELSQRSALCIAGDDIMGMATLFNEAGQSIQGDEKTDVLMDTVLCADKADMAVAVFGVQALIDWGNDKTAFMAERCPNVFQQWAVSNPEAVSVLGAMMVDRLDQAQKMALLSGRGASPEECCLHGLLRSNPNHWTSLTPAWVGTPGSENRQAAIDLGWSPSMLAQMVKGFWEQERPQAQWFDFLSYPYSLCVAVDLAGEMDKARAMGKSIAQMGRKRYSRMEYVQCSANADPQDVALAKMLLKKISPRYGLETHDGTPDVSDTQRAHLQGLVEMHINLDSMDVLVDCLCHGMLPGVSLQAERASEYPLPELGA